LPSRIITNMSELSFIHFAELATMVTLWVYVDLRREVTKIIKWGCIDTKNISNKSQLFFKIWWSYL